VVLCPASKKPRRAVELASHDLGDAFVEDAPELEGTRSVQNGLTGQAGGDLLVQVAGWVPFR
jgi:hypothetical protein